MSGVSVSGTLSLSVLNAADLTSDKNVRPALAGAISSLVGVSKDRVRIDGMAVQRRLRSEGAGTAPARRLWQLLAVDFTIMAENEKTANTAAAVLMQTVPAALQPRLDAEFAAHGVQRSVQVYDLEGRLGTLTTGKPSAPGPGYWDPVPTPAPEGSSDTGKNGVSPAMIAMASVGAVLGLTTLVSGALFFVFYLRGGNARVGNENEAAKACPAEKVEAESVHNAVVGPLAAKASTAWSPASTEAASDPATSRSTSLTSTPTTPNSGLSASLYRSGAPSAVQTNMQWSRGEAELGSRSATSPAQQQQLLQQQLQWNLSQQPQRHQQPRNQRNPRNSQALTSPGGLSYAQPHDLRIRSGSLGNPGTVSYSHDQGSFQARYSLRGASSETTSASRTVGVRRLSYQGGGQRPYGR